MAAGCSYGWLGATAVNRLRDVTASIKNGGGHLKAATTKTYTTSSASYVLSGTNMLVKQKQSKENISPFKKKKILGFGYSQTNNFCSLSFGNILGPLLVLYRGFEGKEEIIKKVTKQSKENIILS